MKNNQIKKEVVEILSKELPQTKIQKTSLDIVKKVVEVSKKPSDIEPNSKIAVANKRISEMVSSKRMPTSKVQPIKNEKILEVVSTPRLKRLSKNITKTSQFNNTSKSGRKEFLDDEITGYSDEYLKTLIELKKYSYVPEEILNTLDEEEYIKYMQDYVIKFKNSILNSDVENFQEIFKDCLKNPMLYQISGYPVHLMSSIFKLVVSNNEYKFKDKLEFSAKYLSILIETENESNVDTSCMPDITVTHAKSFQQGLEISIAKARSSDINDISKQFVMTNDEPKSKTFLEKIKGYYILVGSRQPNYDLTQLDLETKEHIPKDIKVSGIEKTDTVSHKKTNHIIYVGKITKEDLVTLKKNQIDKQITTVKEVIEREDIPENEKNKYQKVKELLHEYQEAKTHLEQIKIFHKIESLGHRINSFVSCDSFVSKDET